MTGGTDNVGDLPTVDLTTELTASKLSVDEDDSIDIFSPLIYWKYGFTWCCVA
jgi:hypothetical protein